MSSASPKHPFVAEEWRRDSEPVRPSRQHHLMDGFGDAVARMRASLSGGDPADVALDEIDATYRELEADHAVKMRRWEANRPAAARR